MLCPTSAGTASGGAWHKGFRGLTAENGRAKKREYLDEITRGVHVRTYLFQVELRQEADGRWSVWIAALPGLTSWGHTKEEALRNIHDAAEAYIEDMLEAGERIPVEAGKIDVIERPAIAVTV